jgi:hypothetical protein
MTFVTNGNYVRSRKIERFGDDAPGSNAGAIMATACLGYSNVNSCKIYRQRKYSLVKDLKRREGFPAAQQRRVAPSPRQSKKPRG